MFNVQYLKSALKFKALQDTSTTLSKNWLFAIYAKFS